MKKIKPLADRVVLKSYSENKEITDSGIYIPQSEKKEVSFIYEVVEVWPWTEKSPMTVKIGDLVLCGQYAGDEVKLDDEQYKIVSVDYLLGIVE